MIRCHDTTGKCKNWNNSRLHTNRKTCDDVCRVSGRRLLNNRVDRGFAHCGIIFSNDAHDRANDSSYYYSEEHVDTGELITAKVKCFRKHPHYDKVRSYHSKDHRRPVTKV